MLSVYYEVIRRYINHVEYSTWFSPRNYLTNNPFRDADDIFYSRYTPLRGYYWRNNRVPSYKRHLQIVAQRIAIRCKMTDLYAQKDHKPAEFYSDTASALCRNIFLNMREDLLPVLADVLEESNYADYSMLDALRLGNVSFASPIVVFGLRELCPVSDV